MGLPAISTPEEDTTTVSKRSGPRGGNFPEEARPGNFFPARGVMAGAFKFESRWDTPRLKAFLTPDGEEGSSEGGVEGGDNAATEGAAFGGVAAKGAGFTGTGGRAFGGGANAARLGALGVELKVCSGSPWRPMTSEEYFRWRLSPTKPSAGVSGNEARLGKGLDRGALRSAATPLSPLTSPWTVCPLSSSPAKKSMVLLYHSTGLAASGTAEQPFKTVRLTKRTTAAAMGRLGPVGRGRDRLGRMNAERLSCLFSMAEKLSLNNTSHHPHNGLSWTDSHNGETIDSHHGET